MAYELSNQAVDRLVICSVDLSFHKLLQNKEKLF